MPNEQANEATKSFYHATERVAEPALQERQARAADDEPREEQPGVTVEQLIQQIKDTADKLVKDKASRGDVKMICTAIKELRYALKVFGRHRDRPKVTIFGSARTLPDHPCYKLAVEFGRQMADAGYTVVTGAASGIMEAGHIGAGIANSLGVNILLPFEQKANAVMDLDEKRLVHFKYFFTRKLMFVKETAAVALFPGGFGTQDEGFEVLTLVQTGKSHLFPLVLVDMPGGNYWERWAAFLRECLLNQGYISPQDFSLFKITSSVDEAVNEIRNFYRVYHSMRYVGDQLVLRLTHPLAPAVLEKLRKEFTDIITTGTFEQTTYLPAEAGETALHHLPRLRFRFDRHSMGRLRQMIDFVNREG